MFMLAGGEFEGNSGDRLRGQSQLLHEQTFRSSGSKNKYQGKINLFWAFKKQLNMVVFKNQSTDKYAFSLVVGK